MFLGFVSHVTNEYWNVDSKFVYTTITPTG